MSFRFLGVFHINVDMGGQDITTILPANEYFEIIIYNITITVQEMIGVVVTDTDMVVSDVILKIIIIMITMIIATIKSVDTNTKNTTTNIVTSTTTVNGNPECR